MTLKRTAYVRFFAVAILVAAWVLIASAATFCEPGAGGTEHARTHACSYAHTCVGTHAWLLA